ncbi:MAG: hypothetical protein JWR38_4527 [Mucilaginibacter sp.]|nr:hypothetical protein [Mucilaginibacter sp.]
MIRIYCTKVFPEYYLNVKLMVINVIIMLSNSVAG